MKSIPFIILYRYKPEITKNIKNIKTIVEKAKILIN